MEEKKNEFIGGFRSVSYFRNFSKLFLFPHSHSKNRGFTLVEILVVIGMIGILASALVALINPVQQMKRSRDSRRKSDIRQIQTGLELYRSDVGSYPPAGTGGTLSSNCSSVSLVNPDCSTTYIQTLPKDPSDSTKDYYYMPNANNGYDIYACLENKKDNDGVSVQTQISDAYACTSGKYYTASNP